MLSVMKILPNMASSVDRIWIGDMYFKLGQLKWMVFMLETGNMS